MDMGLKYRIYYREGVESPLLEMEQMELVKIDPRAVKWTLQSVITFADELKASRKWWMVGVKKYEDVRGPFLYLDADCGPNRLSGKPDNGKTMLDLSGSQNLKAQEEGEEALRLRLMELSRPQGMEGARSTEGTVSHDEQAPAEA